MEAETTLRLAHDCDNVVAVKEASGKMDQVEAIAGAPDSASCTPATTPPRSTS